MKWCLKMAASSQHLSTQEQHSKCTGWRKVLILSHAITIRLFICIWMYNGYRCLSQQFTIQNVHVCGAFIKISICIDTIAWITNCSNLIKVTNDKGILALTVTIIISVCYQIITSPLWDHVDDMLVFWTRPLVMQSTVPESATSRNMEVFIVFLYRKSKQSEYINQYYFISFINLFIFVS